LRITNPTRSSGKSARHLERIDPGRLPLCVLVTGAVDLAMVHALERDRQTKREVFDPSFSAAMDCEGNSSAIRGRKLSDLNAQAERQHRQP
jgi:hypothetical protein